MKDIFANLVALFITLPIPIVIIVFFISAKFFGKKKKALHFTVNSTTLLFILAVHTSLYVIFDRSFFWLILIGLILMLSVSIFLQWKVRQEIQFQRAWRGFWRFNFLLFTLFYIGLTIYGLTNRLLAI